MKEIICTSCHEANPGNSKFCNHCGHILPPPDSNICPKCHASNPKNRYYCDECGTRLATDKIAIDKTEKSTGKIEESSIFSLPARKPGDVAELDPNDLPDWLHGTSADKPTPPESKRPDNMPTWLLNDSQPLLDVPVEITTEHFNALVDTDQSLPEIPELPADKDIDLVDWLADVSGTTGKLSYDEIPTGTTVPDWMPRPDAESGAGSRKTTAELSDDFDFEGLFTFADSDPEDEIDEADDFDSLFDDSKPQTDTSAEEDEFDSIFGDNTDLDGSADFDDFEGLFSDEPEPSDNVDDFESLFDDDPKPEPEIDSTTKAANFDDLFGDDFEADDSTDIDDFESFFDDDSTLEAPPADVDVFADLSDDKPEAASSSEGVDSFDSLFGDLDSTESDDEDDLFGDGFELETAAGDTPSTPDEYALDWLADDGDTLSDSDEGDDEDDLFGDGFELDTAAGDTPSTPDEYALDWLADDEDTLSDSDEGDDESDLFGDEFELETAVSTESDEDEETSDSPSIPDEYALDWLTDDGDSTTSSTEDDWLSDLGDNSSTILLDTPSADDSDDWLSSDAGKATPTNELNELFADTELMEDDGLDWLSSGGDSAPLPADSFFTDKLDPSQISSLPPGTGNLDIGVDGIDLEDEPDWLSEYGTDEFAPMDEPDSDTVDLLDDADDLLDEPELSSEDSGEFSLEITSEDISFASGMIGDEDDLDWTTGGSTAIDDDLPDWLDDLGDIDSTSDEFAVEADDSVPSDIISEVPEWLANLEPVSAGSGSGFSLIDSASGLDVEADFDSITFDEDELSGAGLPEWLQEDATMDETAVSTAVAGLTVTNTAHDNDILDDFLEEDSDDVDLSDLPPSIPIEERLAKATIPEWLEGMRPPPTPKYIEHEPETLGPLVGISNVIGLQTIPTPDYSDAPTNKFVVTDAHQQQARLLRQLTRGERKLASDIVQTDSTTSARMRIALIIILLLLALVGLFGPSLVNLPTEPSPALTALHEEITAVSTQPVLIAFEYTPATAGELNAEAETLLAAFAENGTPVIVVSQSAAGSTIARTHLPVEDGMQIGMVSGGTAGLRQLGECINNTECTTLLGRALPADEQEMLGDVALILLLTGERDNMVNWIEQVSTPNHIPLIAGLTESIAPLALPYYDSGQLAGMMIGWRETAVYQQQWLAEQESGTVAGLNAQALLQFGAVLLLIGGGIYYGMMKKSGQTDGKRA